MPTRKSAPKKVAAKKTAPNKAAAKKAAVKKATPTKAAPKKAAVKKAPAKKAPAKKAAVKKATVKKATVKKASAKKSAVKKAAVKKAPAKRAPVTKAVALAPPPPPPPIWDLATRATTPEAAPGAVTVSFEGPGPQRRLTVAFRIFLAIPHWLFLFVLEIAVFFVAIVGWFAALFTGKLPQGIHTFLGKFVQQYARVSSYSSLLLTDRYPPFSLDEPDYAVSVSVAPARLNRLAVLFRLVLVIPAGIVVSVVGRGLTIAGFVIWLIVLISGRVPATVFEAEAAVLRFKVRYYAFLLMLTSDYPRGLFGDSASDATAATVTDLADLPTRPRITRIVLAKASRRLVILLIVLGALFGIGSAAVSAVNSSDSVRTSIDLDRYHDRLASASVRFTVDARVCAGGLECLHQAHQRLGDAFAKFGEDLESLRFSSSSYSAAMQLRQDAATLQALEEQLATLPNPQYQAAAADYSHLAGIFNNDYRTLVNVLF